MKQNQWFLKQQLRKLQEGGHIPTYQEWLQMSPRQKWNRNVGIARGMLTGAPTIDKIWNAGRALVGGYEPKNPYLIGGEPVIPAVMPTSQSLKIAEMLKQSPQTRQQIEKATTQGVKDLLEYFNSPEYKRRLIKSGASKAEAEQISKFKMNNVKAAKTELYDDFRDARFGHTYIDEPTGTTMVNINANAANTSKLARETTWHEGAHASLNNYSQSLKAQFQSGGKDVLPVTWRKYTENSPIYDRISKHNFELMPELKPSWKAFLENDMEAFNKLASPEDLQVLKDYGNVGTRDFLEYMNTEQEVGARAIAVNVGEFTGQPAEWNPKQLKMFYTKESLDKLKEGVWSLIGAYTSKKFLSHSDYDRPGIRLNQ